MITLILDEIVKVCNKNNINIQSNKKIRDGRNEGTEIEDNVIELLIKESFNNPIFINNLVVFKKSKTREWYDLEITYYDYKFNKNCREFVDIKADNCKGIAGNATGIISLLYVFTSLDFNECSKGNKKTLLKLLSEYKDLNNTKEYYFLIINKSNYSDNFYIPLTYLRLDSVRSNDNNPPFQVDWIRNKQATQKTKSSAYQDLIYNATRETYLKKISDINKNILPFINKL